MPWTQFDHIKKGGTGLKIGTRFKVKKSVTEDHIFIHVSRDRVEYGCLRLWRNVNDDLLIGLLLVVVFLFF